ncbi:MAG: sprT domain-containing protein [Bacteroidia bacterium]|nr:sprT domain-containing protein [Bacteroidia bacterium]
MNNPDDIQVLARYLPEKAINFVLEYIYTYNIYLKINPPRSSKMGDYHPPNKKHGHKITINGNLNPYPFLLTLAHEFAHLEVWEKYKNNVKHHGTEWFNEYKHILKFLIQKEIFPEDLKHGIIDCFFVKNYTSESYSEELDELLSKYSGNQSIKLKDIAENSIFSLMSGRKFIKLSKVRKRYKCRDLSNGRIYLIHPLAEVRI